MDIVIHNYRWRLSLAEGIPRYAKWEKRVAKLPAISAPTLPPAGLTALSLCRFDVFGAWFRVNEASRPSGGRAAA